MQLSKLDDSMVLFLAALPEEEYSLLLKIFELFEECRIKDQKLSRAKRVQVSKLDCVGSNFKCLRGVDAGPRMELLKQMAEEKLSFPELGVSCRYAKKMRNVQKAFLKYNQLSSWEEATEKYPLYTKVEKLEPFMNLAFKADAIPPSFIAYCQHAKRLAEIHPSTESANFIPVGNVHSVLLRRDVLSLCTEDLLFELGNIGFPGFHLSIIDPPKVCDMSHVPKYIVVG